jgi:hypothetical protein
MENKVAIIIIVEYVTTKYYFYTEIWYDIVWKHVATAVQVENRTLLLHVPFRWS